MYVLCNNIIYTYKMHHIYIYQILKWVYIDIYIYVCVVIIYKITYNICSMYMFSR